MQKTEYHLTGRQKLILSNCIDAKLEEVKAINVGLNTDGAVLEVFMNDLRNSDKIIIQKE